MTGLRLVPQNRRFRGGRCWLDAGQSRCSAHSAVLAARPPTRATARAARQRSAQNRHLGSARAPGFPPRRPSRRSILPRCCQIPDHNPRGRPEPATLRGTAAARPASAPRRSGPGPDCGFSRHHRRSRQPAGGPRRPPARLRRSCRRSARDGQGPDRPSRPPPPVRADTHTHRRPCAAPQPADPLACFVRPACEKAPPTHHQRATADSGQDRRQLRQPKQRRATPTGDRRNRGLSRLQEKPRQCITDGRWWTAGRIGGNRNSPSGGAQPLPVVEGIVVLVVVVTMKAVFPGDVGLRRQSTPSGCPCGCLADNAGRSGPLQRWQEVRVTREQHHNVAVVVDCAKREVQGDLHIDPFLARAASAVVKRPCADFQLGPIFTGHVLPSAHLSARGSVANWVLRRTGHASVDPRLHEPAQLRPGPRLSERRCHQSRLYRRPSCRGLLP